MRDSRLGLALGGGSRPESDEPIPLLLLASFISFFQETYVVSPCLSSTFSNFRSPAVNSFGEEGFDDSPGVEASSVVVGFGSSIWWIWVGLETRIGVRGEDFKEGRLKGIWDERGRLELRGGRLRGIAQQWRFAFFYLFLVYLLFLFWFLFFEWKYTVVCWRGHYGKVALICGSWVRTFLNPNRMRSVDQ